MRPALSFPGSASLRAQDLTRSVATVFPAWERRSAPFGLLGCLLAFLLAACSPEIQPLLLSATPWQAGEVSSYAISDVNGMAAGTARYEINAGESNTNPTGWIIRRTIEAQGDTEAATVTVNAALRPQRSELARSGAQGKQVVNAVYNQGQVDLELTNQSVTTVERINVPSDAYDEYMLWQLGRVLPLAAGYATQINTFHTITGVQNRVTVTVMGAETVTVPAGSFATWQVEFTTNTGKSTVWYTQAAPYTVVKFVEGRNQGTFELTEYQPGP
jgi:Protein of unknown function (DUF3108)